MPDLRECAATFLPTRQALLDREFAGRWIGRGGPIASPPRSPDLTPPDIFLWGCVKNIFYQVKISDLQHMKDRTREAVATVTEALAMGLRAS
jgi:hypothetical protein